MATGFGVSLPIQIRYALWFQFVTILQGAGMPSAQVQQHPHDFYRPQLLSFRNIDWVTFIWMITMHVGVLAAPFFFTWTALFVCIVLHWMTACLGVTLGYHRYLSHRAMKLRSPMKLFIMFCGTLSGQGSPLMWAANHRMHHDLSDEEGDPHSPRDGRFWSHILWLFLPLSRPQRDRLMERYTPDLLKQPMMQFFEVAQKFILPLSDVALYLIGGWPILLWGLCVRMVVVYHSTWLVNSATHLWGYRTYVTSDDSRNNWWVALLTYGEGWHNNHHKYPTLARSGHRQWEIDMTFWMIRAMQYCGMATDIVNDLPSPLNAIDRNPQTSLAIEITKEREALKEKVPVGIS